MFLCQATIPLPSMAELLHQTDRKHQSSSYQGRLSLRILQDEIIKPNPECVRRRSLASSVVLDTFECVPRDVRIPSVQSADELPTDFWQHSIKKIVIRETL